ncbi:lipid droplet phospholipase 1-like [Tasmannia lanceolata]|uniref:lipid droplet phospholipase 1-like n=1 Tax=Tasmannia lanceolata TaxID=3420 RepID=UPI004063EC87
MASLEPKTKPTTADSNMKRRKKRRYISRIGCFGSNPNPKSLEIRDGDRSLEMEANNGGDHPSPTHLVVFVNGIIGSAANWRFAAKQFVKRFPEDVIAHCSECNSGTLTFDGVDVMGERLAEEVISVIEHRPQLQKISFVGHSLGGLVARYAIGRLYGKKITKESSEENGDCRSFEYENQCLDEKPKGKVAGLEPMNFITVATPHLGSRGHKQLPILCGFQVLEKVASRTSWIIGRTGKHLFLNDSDEGKLPLLLQMVNDCEDLRFMSALQAFKRHVAYANAHFDHIVGWKTSSIRHQHELPKRQLLKKHDKYPHIVNVEPPKTTSVKQEVPLKANVKTIDMEDEMIRGLNKVGWERVDVSFRRSKQRFFAHSTIQVYEKRNGFSV